MSHGRIVSASEQGQLLEPDQLARLERNFRDWVAEASRGRRLSRIRILLLFLLIRYTGAKLNEVLGLHVERDISLERRAVSYHGSEETEGETREVHISERLAEEISGLIRLLRAGETQKPPKAPGAPENAETLFAIDPAFVRRKFYERARACGFNPRQGGPEMIRKARALELMRNDMPLPVVQRLLGHSTPNLTASHISFSEDDMRQVTRWFMERESGRKTSARNSFFGKVSAVTGGEPQSLVELVTPEGDRIRTMVTNSSVERLGLKVGRLASAEIKAPWLYLEHADRPGLSSADNICRGVITGIAGGSVNVECQVGVREGMTLCAIVSAPGFAGLGLQVGDPVRVLFSCYAVILHTE